MNHRDKTGKRQTSALRRGLMVLLMVAASIVNMQAQTAEDLRDEADSLYNAQQYDAAKDVALRALPQAAGGG